MILKTAIPRNLPPDQRDICVLHQAQLLSREVVSLDTIHIILHQFAKDVEQLDGEPRLTAFILILLVAFCCTS